MARFSLWLNAGVKPNHSSNASHIRLSNIIALLFAILLVLQLGLCLHFWSEGGHRQAVLIVLYASLCTAIPLLNHYLRPFYGRWALILLFITYILQTSGHLGRLSHSHDFLLMGLFLCPFLFSGQQRLEIALALLLLTASYAAVELSPSTVFSAQTSIDYQQTVAGLNRISFALAALLAAYLIHQDHHKSWQRLAFEQQRSESLLLSILPKPIARRLQTSRQPVADYFDNATVLFTDIEGFSEISKTRAPTELVDYLNTIYSAFDHLLEQHGLEKIKTNGDEYMAVSGVPVPNDDHAQRCCRCAIAMLDTYNDITHRYGLANGLRIGINSGELVAGIIGKYRFSYDIWGDNVNLASRMESQGVSQQIQVSEATYRLCKDQFSFIDKGQIHVKGMGRQRVYWLDQNSSRLASA
ncbi:Guanylate cyclase [Saliniradius amylolyticus]|uniref:Guanylate cyclase n=1 Tax=Saliniradius amylolyticus TaxID=2183582 RepID=A0A2S2E531_9ALTE|nr:adenylate/guanylate cyclase domain-containing protein [Saliniradius amylolyticus]AWL12097.1 Guanylate cyclase [Saliniradius amylolyticus]